MSGYKVVPVEPTVAMREVWKHMRGYCWHDKYKAMLDAAPAVNHEPVAYRCHNCLKAVPAPAPFKAHVECTECGALTAVTAAATPAFQLGDHVRKTKGSQWKGRVVGTYSTSLTPEGYAVESDTEKGSVQIYPVGALELVAAHRKGGDA